MRAHITTKPWKLAILLTLAPFYPPGNTKASQKWLLLVKAVFHKSKNKKDFLVGRRGSWGGGSHKRCKKVALTGSGAMDERDGFVFVGFNRALIIWKVMGDRISGRTA